MPWVLMFDEWQHEGRHHLSQSNIGFFRTIIGKKDNPIKIGCYLSGKKGG
jgi:hypothetical protein